MRHYCRRKLKNMVARPGNEALYSRVHARHPSTTVCLTLDHKLSFFFFHILLEYNQKIYPGLGQSSNFIQCSTSLASQPSSQQCMQRTQRRAHCSLYNTCGRLGMSYEAFHHSSSPFHYSIPLNVDTIPFNRM